MRRWLVRRKASPGPDRTGHNSGRQLRIRCYTGTPNHRVDQRAGNLPGHGRKYSLALPGAIFLSETGTIKFVPERSQPQLGSFKGLDELNLYRKKVRDLGLLGVDQNGIGFGNISVREAASSRFFITGSNTGHKSELTADDCAKVIQYRFSRNWLLFEGKTM